MANALAVTRAGVPLGLIDQIGWSRPPTEDLTHIERVQKNAARAFEAKEPYEILQASHARAIVESYETRWRVRRRQSRRAWSG